MYVETVPNRNSPPAILLRESYREGGKVKKRTLANLVAWPAELVEHFKVLLRGGVAVESSKAALTIERSLPHGHVAAVLGMARACGVPAWLAAAGKLSPMLLALIAARIVEPASKLATYRMLHHNTATSSLGRVLKVGGADQNDLYAALYWLGAHQEAIERRLAKKHLVDGVLVLYDLT